MYRLQSTQQVSNLRNNRWVLEGGMSRHWHEDDVVPIDALEVWASRKALLVDRGAQGVPS
jgi:hypothetical protein